MQTTESLMIKKWIEAMRLRTLPVSIAGVIAGTACAIQHNSFRAIPALLCLMFAVLAQIASNFGNEYYDFKNGLDRKGREGFRRGVTEGDITPQAMKNATFITLALAGATGLMMLFYGEWWLIPMGAAIGISALAYSTGPYPLSHHGLGDIAVIIFFGIVPVTLTCMLQQGDWSGIGTSLPTSVTIGILAANVLVVNNYRDMDDDKEVGKRTTVVIFGRKAMGTAYLAGGFIAMAAMVPVWKNIPLWGLSAPAIYLILHTAIWKRIIGSQGSALNPLLGKTALNLLLFSFMFLAASIAG